MTEGADIRIAFGEAVAERLTGSRWRPSLQPLTADDEVAVYEFPLDDEFGLEARFFCYEGEEGQSELDAAVRLSHRLATQVVKALGLVGGDGMPAGLTDLTGQDEVVPLVVASAADARSAGARFADLVADGGPAWGRRHATVDALVALVVEDGADPDREGGQRLFASSIILGAAGRVRDAQAALRAELQRSPRLARERNQAEIAAVARWLADGASITPPQARPGRQDTNPGIGSFLGAMGGSFQDNRVKRAVKQSVASHRAGKTRDQLRELYVTEAGEKNLVVDPLSVESFLDTLEIESRSERTRTGLAALAGAAKLIRGTIAEINTAARSMSPETFPLPDIAAYPSSDDSAMGEGRRWALVEIGPEAATLVDDLVAEPSSPVPTTVHVYGWLSTDPLATGSPLPITVNLDGHHLGVLTAPAATAFRDGLDIAGTLDLVPFVKLRISRRARPPLRLIEISVPSSH